MAESITVQGKTKMHLLDITSDNERGQGSRAMFGQMVAAEAATPVRGLVPSKLQCIVTNAGVGSIR
jgi:hypothetical protein